MSEPKLTMVACGVHHAACACGEETTVMLYSALMHAAECFAEWEKMMSLLGRTVIAQEAARQGKKCREALARYEATKIDKSHLG